MNEPHHKFYNVKVSQYRKESYMNKFGTFWYSKKQDSVISEITQQNVINFMRPLFHNKTKIYTEWNSRFPFLPTGKWDDYKFVGIGFYDHSETH